MMLGLHKVVFVKFLSGDNGTEGGAKRGAGKSPIVDGDG